MVHRWNGGVSYQQNDPKLVQSIARCHDTAAMVIDSVECGGQERTDGNSQVEIGKDDLVVVLSVRTASQCHAISSCWEAEEQQNPNEMRCTNRC